MLKIFLLQSKMTYNSKLSKYLDFFRLKLLYGYILQNCRHSDLNVVIDEIVFLEDKSFCEYNANVKSGVDFSFIFPSVDSIIDSFSYLASEMACCRAMSNITFLSATYKYHELNNFLSTNRYKKIYKKSNNVKSIVSESLQDYVYASGEINAMSDRLRKRLNSSKIVDISEAL